MLGEVADDLKEKYGKHIIFWGGGVDTQKTLPLEIREEVAREVEERLKTFSKVADLYLIPYIIFRQKHLLKILLQ